MFKLIAFSLLSVISLNSCSEKEQKIEFSGHTMGTSYHITLADNLRNPRVSAKNLHEQLDKLLEEINQQMSTYQADTEISQFNQTASLDWFPVSQDFLQVVKQAQEVSLHTHGAFDITVAPLVNAWGFGKETQFKTPEKKQLEAIKKYVGYQKLKYRPTPSALKKTHGKLQIDLSAIAKGFAVDKLSEYLISQNYKNFMVEIGGELRVKGKSPTANDWRIAIHDPRINIPKTKSANIYNPVKQLLISDAAVATSGNYLNYFIKNKIRYSHILDPRTGKPKTQKAMSATVVHKSAMMADAYATALMVLGQKSGQQIADQIGLEVYWLKPQ